jgi:hypothetical protein
MLLDAAGNRIEADAANPNQRIVLEPPFDIRPYDLVRREKRSAP